MINQDSGENRPCSRVKPKVKYSLFQRERVIFYTLFQSQRGKKHNLLSGTYPCSPYMGVPSPQGINCTTMHRLLCVTRFRSLILLVLTDASRFGIVPSATLIADQQLESFHIVTWKAVISHSVSYCQIISFFITKDLFISKINFSRVLTEDF